jgi:hypothetical protein
MRRRRAYLPPDSAVGEREDAVPGRPPRVMGGVRQRGSARAIAKVR